METQYRIRNILMTLFIIAKGEPDDYGPAESKEGDDLKSIDNRGMPHETYYGNIQRS